jgi:hypothetical protein
MGIPRKLFDVIRSAETGLGTTRPGKFVKKKLLKMAIYL